MTTPANDAATPWLARLGVFQQGAQESLLLAITGLAPVGPRGLLASGIEPDSWQQLRQQWLSQDLIREHRLQASSRPWLEIRGEQAHIAFQQLKPAQRAQLQRQHQRHYFQFAGQLKQRQQREPQAVEELLRYEANNLHQALENADNQGEEYALEFAQRLKVLLPALADRGTQNTTAALIQTIEQQASSQGSAQHLRQHSNHIEQLIQHGEWQAAIDALQTLLTETATASTDPHYRAAQHARLAYCHSQNDEHPTALEHYAQALNISDKLTPSQAVHELRLTIQLDQSALYTRQQQFHQAILCGNQALRSAQALNAWDKLTTIAEQLAQIAQACEDHDKQLAYRRMAARSWRQSDQGQQALRDYQDFIEVVEQSIQASKPNRALKAQLKEARASDWKAGANAIEQLIHGERDSATLCAQLNTQDHALMLYLLERNP